MMFFNKTVRTFCYSSFSLVFLNDHIEDNMKVAITKEQISQFVCYLVGSNIK